MQISTSLQWRNANVKSDGSGSKGLTHCICMCYRCCALEHGTYRRARRTQRGLAICTSVQLASDRDCASGNERRTQNACASVPIRIVSYTVIVPCTLLYDVPIKHFRSTWYKYCHLYHWSILHKPPPGCVQVTHCIHRTNFKISLAQPVS